MYWVSRTWSCLVAQDVAGGEPLQVGGHQPFILQQQHFLYLRKNERNYDIKIYQTHMFCLFLKLCEEMVLEGYAFEKARTYFFTSSPQSGSINFLDRIQIRFFLDYIYWEEKNVEPRLEFTDFRRSVLLPSPRSRAKQGQC